MIRANNISDLPPTTACTSKPTTLPCGGTVNHTVTDIITNVNIHKPTYSQHADPWNITM